MIDLPHKWRFVKLKQKNSDRLPIKFESDLGFTFCQVMDFRRGGGGWARKKRRGEVVSSHSGLVREGWSCKRSRIRSRSRIRQRSRIWLRSRTRRRVDGGVGLGLQQEEEEEEEEEVGELRRWRREIPPRQAVVSD